MLPREMVVASLLFKTSQQIRRTRWRDDGSRNIRCGENNTHRSGIHIRRTGWKSSLKCGQLGLKRGDLNILSIRRRKERRRKERRLAARGRRRLAARWGTGKAGKNIQGRGAATNGRHERFEVREGDLDRVVVVPNTHSSIKKGFRIVEKTGNSQERGATDSERLGPRRWIRCRRVV
jgi:hypothetical protein